MSSFTGLGQSFMGGPSPNALSSPPIDPRILALLSGRMTGGGGMPGPGGMPGMPPQMMPHPQMGMPPGMPQPGMPPQMQQPGMPQGAPGPMMPPGAGATPGQGGPLQALMGMDPARLKQLLASLGIGGPGGVPGNGMPGGGAPPMPGFMPGGGY